MSPLEEIKSYQPHARRLFWTGANPFAMNYDNIKLRALTVRDYLIKCQTIAMFASIRDIKHKSVHQEYYFVYMTGLAGKGNGYQNAVNSTKVFSKLNPYFISIDSLTLFPDTE